MSIFGFKEVASLAGLGALTFWQTSRFTKSGSRIWYEAQKPWWGPPGYVFPIAWTLLYAALTAAMFYFAQNTPADSWQLITGIILYVFHIFWNKKWSEYFWDEQDPESALNILVFPMLLSAAGLQVCFIVDQTGLFWVPVMLLSIYMAWLVYAMALNVYWVNQKAYTR